MRNNKESDESDDGRLSSWKADLVPLSCEKQTPSSSSNFLRLHTHLTNMFTLRSVRLLPCKWVSAPHAFEEIKMRYIVKCSQV